jgi:hypothetical protein
MMHRDYFFRVSNRLFFLGAFCFTVAAVSGCGGSGANLGKVTGKVTLAGQPVNEALVMFSPVNGGSPSVGRTTADGSYTLVYARGINGAVVGDHTVTISTYKEALEDPPTPEVKETVPLKYREGDDLPKVTVKSGSNNLDFTLEAGPVDAPPPAKTGKKTSTTGCF